MTQQTFGNRAIAQIAIVVRNVEQAAARYATIFGVEKPNIIISDGYDKAHTTYKGQASHAQVRMAFFDMGQVQLELIQPVGEPSAWKDGLDKHGEGFHHIAFWVPDTEASVKDLAQHGISVIQQGDFEGGMYTYLDSEDQMGVMLELLQRK